MSSSAISPICSCLCYSIACAKPISLRRDRKSTRLNSSHGYISYAVFCLKKKKIFVRRSLALLCHPHDIRDSCLLCLLPIHLSCICLLSPMVALRYSCVVLAT